MAIKHHSNENFLDSNKLTFGTSDDLEIYHDGTNSVINNTTGDLQIYNNANDKDVVFLSDDGSGGTEIYFFLDGSSSSGNPFTTFPDNSLLSFGTGRDFIINHNGSNTNLGNYTGDIEIVNYANDKDIILKSDDGSGGTTAYLTLDGSAETVEVAKPLNITGDTAITGHLDVTSSSASGSPLIRFNQTTTRRGFIQMADTDNNLRVASEYGSVSLEAASSGGSDSDTSYIRIQPGGTVEIGAVDGDATIATDGNMTFRIDADNDETSQKFVFQNNASTEIASLDESGNLTTNNVFLPGGGTISFDDSLDGTDQFITGIDSNLTIDGDDKIKLRADTQIEVKSTSNTDTVIITNNSGNIFTAGDIELGHASDTTISRSAAGVVKIEGNQVVTTKTTTITSGGDDEPIATLIGRRTLTTAEMNDLHNTPIELVPAPGANTVALLTGGMIRVDRAATNTSSTSTLDFHYEGLEPAGFGTSSLIHLRRFHFNKTTDGVYNLGATQSAGTPHATSLTEDVNKAIEVSFAGAATTNCFTSVDIYITYQLIKIA